MKHLLCLASAFKCGAKILAIVNIIKNLVIISVLTVSAFCVFKILKDKKEWHLDSGVYIIEDAVLEEK